MSSEFGSNAGVYLNNAATTWPKPPSVVSAVADFMTRGGANLGRGTSSPRDLGALNVVLDCRIKLMELFGGYDPRYVTFCANVTEALNVVLKGFLKPGMRVLSSLMEHNAVVRPLRSLELGGTQLVFAECSRRGFLDPLDVRRLLGTTRFDLVVLSHASNVCGTVQPLGEIAEICREASVPLILDSAQTAGILPISARELGLSAVCFTGHKGLMAPQGIGGIVWKPEFAERVAPLVEGGTGSYSHVEFQPSDMPDKFESGTPNLPGIAGLHAALVWLEETGIGRIEDKERRLGERFLEKMQRHAGAVLYGMPTMSGRLPVFSLNFEGADNSVLADELAVRGFETRPGLHCAPLAHKTLGSFPQGSLRVSLGYFNTPEEIGAFWEAIAECTRKS